VGTVTDVRKLPIPIISLENERQTLQLLIDICTEQIKHYPTTVEEDEKMLEENDLTYNQRNCVIFRASEKNTLKILIEVAQRGIQILQGGLLTEEDSKVRYFIELKHAFDTNP
jgi:hypothetical protein